MQSATEVLGSIETFLTKSQLVRNMVCVYLKSGPRGPHDELTCANVSVQVLENT